MSKLKSFLTLVFACIAIFSVAQSQTFTAEKMWEMERVGSFDVSPDGNFAVFPVTE